MYPVDDDPKLLAVHYRWSTGAVVTGIVDKWLRGGEFPLPTDDEVAEIAAVAAQAAQAATPIPGFVWKRIFAHLIRRVSRSRFQPLALIVATIVCWGLPIYVVVNAHAFFDFLVRSGLFKFFDWLRSL